MRTRRERVDLSRDLEAVRQFGRTFSLAGDAAPSPAASRPPSWPSDVPVPLRLVRGPHFAPEGTEEGALCGRTYPGVRVCQGRLEARPAYDSDGCSCHQGGAPCGHCMSYAPQCPKCGWRGEEA